MIDASRVRVPGRAPRWIVPVVKASLVVADTLAAAISFMLAFYVRERISVFAAGGGLAWSDRFAPYGALLVFVVCIRLLSFRYFNLYRVRGEFSFFDDAVRIFKAAAIGSLLIVAAAFLYRGGFEFRAFSYARSVFVADFIFVLVSIGAVRFLMRAAVLERLSGPLCDHVVGTGGSAARLETLARANLFVLPLDRERGWYRYHRAFREYLLAELRRREPDAIPDLNRRAAAWCEAAGVVSAAASYAHAGGDLDGVARLVTLDGLTAATARSATGERWLAWFDRPERLRAHPDIAVLGAWAHLVHGRPAEGRRWRNAAVAAAEDAHESELAVLRAARCERGVEQMRADARTALAGLGPVSPWQPLARLLGGVAELLLGKEVEAEEMLGDAAECAESAREPELQAWALSELALLVWASGEEARAEELAVAACALVDGWQPADDPSSALALALSARLHLRRGRTKAARLDLGRADSLVRQLGAALPWYAAQTTLELVRLELALADPAAARRRLDGATAVLGRRPRLGVLVRQAAELADEIRALAARRDARQSGLTTAELRLLPLLTTHLSFREIAEELYVSRNTVKTQAISVYRKLNASSRSEAIARARDLGLVDASSPRVEFTPSG